MKEFKDIPSNKRYIEGSIAEAYVVSESVTYAMEYMPNALGGSHRSTREDFLDDYGEYSDEMAILEGESVRLTTTQFVQIRRWVLFRLQVEGLADYYR
jgi:hypothetical protein